jgi:CRP/FNR family transcriptional regulator
LLKPEEVELISNSKTQIIFNKGELLTKQGAYSSYLLYIIKGIVKKHIEDSSEKYLNISLHTNDEFIGLSSLFQQNKYIYTTTALTETQVILIELSSLNAVIKNNAAFAYELIKTYCKENKTIYEILNTITFKQMYSKLARTLLYLDDWNDKNIFNLLNRKEIAAFCGLSVETTVKLLKEFENDNIIKLIDKNIIILNKEKLLEYSKL